MSKSSSSPPAAPDPQQTAQAQTQSNVATARVQGRMNRNNVVNPYYSTTWTDMGDRTKNPDGSVKPPPAVANNNPDMDSPTPSPQSQSTQPESTSTRDPNDPMAGEQDYFNQDRWQQTVTLNPEEQKILDQSRRLQLGVGGLAEGQIPRIKNALNTTVDFSGLPERSTGVDYGALQNVNANFSRSPLASALSGAGGNVQTSVAPGGNIQTDLDVDGQWNYDSIGGPNRTVSPIGWADQLQGVSDASYNQAKSRLDPQWQQREEEFAQNLADRGVPQGSDDWNAQMAEFQRNRTDAYQTAQNNATLAGNSLLGTLGGLELGKFGAENAAQAQEFGQTGQQREDLFSQALRKGTFGNQAQALAFGQNLDTARFANDAQAQLFGQDLASKQFQNAAQGQDFMQNLQQQQLALQLRQQGLSEQQVQAALAEAARTGGYAERLGVRNQALTDAQALMGMGG